MKNSPNFFDVSVTVRIFNGKEDDIGFITFFKINHIKMINFEKELLKCVKNYHRKSDLISILAVTFNICD
jgi:hypothetical protein